MNLKKTFIAVTLLGVIWLSAGCDPVPDTSITEEMDVRWEKMTSEEQATFCFGALTQSDYELYESAVDSFGDDAEEAVIWTENKCK